MSFPGLFRPISWRAAVIAVLGFSAVAAGAVERRVSIHAPSKVVAGSTFNVTVVASTDAGQGERVGFFQVEASVDGGKTWSAVCYLDNLGNNISRPVSLKAGAAGTQVRVRVRVAFRAGAAADVDYTGAAIRWAESWDKWQEPPAKSVAIAVGN